MARFARARLQIGDLPDHDLTQQLFFSFLLPQFEGVGDAEGRVLYRTVSELVGQRLQAQLRSTLTTVLGVQLPQRAAPAEEPIEAEEFGFTDPDVQ
jgi:hypothetical protein